jgi:hypothetical protein
MAALPLLLTQSEGLHPSISPQPQRPPPPRQTKLAMTGPAELVTCDQTIEHTVRFAKQTLGWTTPRVRHPEQADWWTWLVLAAYAQLRLAPGRGRRPAAALGTTPATSTAHPLPGPARDCVTAVHAGLTGQPAETLWPLPGTPKGPLLRARRTPPGRQKAA